MEGNFNGNFEDANLDGNGSIFFDRGNYKGQLKDSEPHGEGLLETPGGDIYEGEFKKG